MRGAFALPWARGRWLLFLPALCCLACSGRESLQDVRGQVLFQKQPGKGVLVTFHPKDATITVVRPTGFTDDAGRFNLTTGDKPGARPGEYTVTFIWPEEVVDKAKKTISTEPPDSRDRLNGAYADPQKSSFKVEIKKGPNELEPFHLQ